MSAEEVDRITDQMMHNYLESYIRENRTARVVANGLRVVGIGLRPVVDHITFLTYEIDERAREFLDLGFEHGAQEDILLGHNWWGKLYRKAGYPVVMIKQPIKDQRVKKSFISDWVAESGDQMLFSMAVRVEDVESAIFYLEKQGVSFTHKIAGEKGSDLRQVFAKPEVRNGRILNVFEFTERREGFQGYIMAYEEKLMGSIFF